MTAVATLLADHVTFQLDSVDRLLLAGYIPELQYEGGVVRFLIDWGYRIPSPTGRGHNHDRLVGDLESMKLIDQTVGDNHEKELIEGDCIVRRGSGASLFPPLDGT